MKRSAKASKMSFSLSSLFGMGKMKKTLSKRTRRRRTHKRGKTCRMRGG